MKYRGLTFDRARLEYKWVYGLPSYGYETDEVSEIGTPEGEFYSINPSTLGKETEYRDKKGKQMYTGDIAVLEVDGEIREFVVECATVDREYNTLLGFENGTVKVRLADVVVFSWTDPDGIIHKLLPCIDHMGTDDTCKMEIIDTVAEREVRESAGKSKK